MFNKAAFVFAASFLMASCGQKNSDAASTENETWEDLIPVEYRSNSIRCITAENAETQIDITLNVAEDEQTAVISGSLSDVATTLMRVEQKNPSLAYQLPASEDNQADARLELERYYLDGKMIGYVRFSDDKIVTIECRYAE